MSDKNEFKDGQEVKVIYLQGGGEFKAGIPGCDRITVSMENGQMAPVPWFIVWVDGIIDSKWNGALLLGVKIA